MKAKQSKITRRQSEFCAQLETARTTEPNFQDPWDDPAGPDNADRSGWAENTLARFNELTGSDLDTVIRDLIADLGHFCDRHGLNMAQEIKSGAGMYDEETDGKGSQFSGI